MDILIINLLIHVHGRSFCLVIYSLISFFKDLKFLLHKTFTCLVRVMPRYFILFKVIVKDVDSLISFSAHLSFGYRRTTDYFELICIQLMCISSVCCEYHWLLKNLHRLIVAQNKARQKFQEGRGGESRWNQRETI